MGSQLIAEQKRNFSVSAPLVPESSLLSRESGSPFSFLNLSKRKIKANWLILEETLSFGNGAHAQNPHETIAAYAKDLDIVVFNGHVHTTELYEVDGGSLWYWAGGGAEQDPILQ